MIDFLKGLFVAITTLFLTMALFLGLFRQPDYRLVDDNQTTVEMRLLQKEAEEALSIIQKTREGIK